MWPVVEGTELREDIRILIKFWQSILSDKKYMKNFMNALDPFQLGQQSSVGPGSQYSSSQTGLGPYLPVSSLFGYTSAQSMKLIVFRGPWDTGC